MTILPGDFNAKVGKRRHIGITCLGDFCRGRTNDKGKTLIYFFAISVIFLLVTVLSNIQHITSLHRKAK